MKKVLILMLIFCVVQGFAARVEYKYLSKLPEDSPLRKRCDEIHTAWFFTDDIKNACALMEYRADKFIQLHRVHEEQSKNSKYCQGYHDGMKTDKKLSTEEIDKALLVLDATEQDKNNLDSIINEQIVAGRKPISIFNDF